MPNRRGRRSNSEEAKSAPARPLRHRVAAVVDALRPMAQNDGGDLELVDVDESGVVQLRLHGACVGCPSSAVTLALGVERTLKERVPEVTRVVCTPS